MAPDSTCRNFSNSGILITLHGSLRKQQTLGDTITGFPANWRLRNERRNSILMTRHYPDLDSASDWLNQIFHEERPFSSSIQIWVVTRHQYGISTLVFRTSFGGRKLVLVLTGYLHGQSEFLEVKLILLSQILKCSDMLRVQFFSTL